MIKYIHERADWPAISWDREVFCDVLASVSRRQGNLLGRMTSLGFESSQAASLQILTEDVVQTSAIEGESLNRDDVRSSIAKKLGIDSGLADRNTRHVDGIVSVLVDATTNFADELTADRLYAWHCLLFPTGRIGMRGVVGAWRDEEMVVASGQTVNARIHYEAPTPDRLDREMSQFLAWFNSSDPIDPIVKSAVAHLWFVTIHPFEDGNGRIARAIADLALARADQMKQRFYSMSRQILHDRKEYYTALERTQRGTLDITNWIVWFLACLDNALTDAESLLETVIAKDRFWNQHAGDVQNERQREMINRLFDGFTGKLTSVRWAKITDCSQQKALRDITPLVTAGILLRHGTGARNTHYTLASQK